MELTVETKSIVDGALYAHTLTDGNKGQIKIYSSEPKWGVAAPSVLLSGGYDPYHAGHVASVNGAASHGNVIVIANGDNFLKQKRAGDVLLPAPYLPLEIRLLSLANLRNVHGVVVSIDEDETVCETIRALKRMSSLKVRWFANGGDRGKANTPEQAVCNELGIGMIWACGGESKLGNSSEIVRTAALQVSVDLMQSLTTTRWGAYATLSHNENGATKLLKFNPHAGVSLQTHARRSEVWDVQAGGGTLYLGKVVDGKQVMDGAGMPVLGQVIALQSGITIPIRLGQAHMCQADRDGLVVYEKWVGDSEESDIERFGDPFNVPEDAQRCNAWLYPQQRVVAAE